MYVWGRAIHSPQTDRHPDSVNEGGKRAFTAGGREGGRERGKEGICFLAPKMRWEWRRGEGRKRKRNGQADTERERERERQIQISERSVL